MYLVYNQLIRRGGRVVEGARLESVYRGNSIMGSNPILSAINLSLFFKENLRLNRHFKKDKSAIFFKKCYKYNFPKTKK